MKSNAGNISRFGIKMSWVTSLKTGFTLIELLIVIAIIGILATVVLASMANSKQKSTDASALSTMASTDKVAMVCASSLLNISNPSALGAICVGAANYADITVDVPWVYTASYAIGANACNQDLTAADGTFTICAQNPAASPTKGIKCVETGCSKVGF
jgi:prepilin-type N-terminal cleavage/methylation domain-containing protein